MRFKHAMHARPPSVGYLVFSCRVLQLYPRMQFSSSNPKRNTSMRHLPQVKDELISASHHLYYLRVFGALLTVK